jgi:hypothetical protein
MSTSARPPILLNVHFLRFDIITPYSYLAPGVTNVCIRPDTSTNFLSTITTATMLFRPGKAFVAVAAEVYPGLVFYAS